jgi:hypothetical protein
VLSTVELVYSKYLAAFQLTATHQLTTRKRLPPGQFVLFGVANSTEQKRSLPEVITRISSW